MDKVEKDLCKKTKFKVLFVIKKRGDHYVSYGLVNSCKFVGNALTKYDVDFKIVQVQDANFIDREVYQYKPTHVFVEAIWVPPTKFPVLFNLKHNRDAIWSVRLHSQASFLGLESIGFNWTKQYLDLKEIYPFFGVSTNSLRLKKEFHGALNQELEYTPNIYYPDKYGCLSKTIEKSCKVIDIGLFGAVRPYKAHVAQALAAMTFANQLGKKLRLHINVQRFENFGAESVYKNLRAIFEGEQHELIEHPWMTHENFIGIVRQMDLGMQCSLTETQNIVACDFVSQNIPIVVSDEMEWASWFYKAKPMWMEDIVNKLYLAYYGKEFGLQHLNKLGLDVWNKKAERAWLDYLK